jgi:hypothetical protein
MLPAWLTRSVEGIQVARTLGAVYFRPEAVLLDRWDGRCLSCDLARGVGLKLVLTVRTTGPGPSPPPRDLASYRRTLREVLDRLRPAVLVIENEENSTLFYTGTPEEYGGELTAACQVAHERDVPCAPGGLVSTLVALLVYDHYLSTGQPSAAADFARRAFAAEQLQHLGSPRAQDQIRKGKALLAAYRRAGADYVNFHWYIRDPRALEEAVAFLQAQVGRPALTNEIGQLTDDPAWTTAVMAAVVNAGLPVAIWFGLDGPRARGLVDPDGRLRPAGLAFQQFIREQFPSPTRR